MRYAEVDVRSSKLPAQSASEKHVSAGWDALWIVIPWNMVFFKYRNRRLVAVQ